MKIEQELQTTGFRNEFHKAMLNIIFSSWWLKSQFVPTLKKFGVTHEQFNVLRIVRGRQSSCICARDIGQRMVERGSNVTRIVDKLEAKGLVVRKVSEEDRRELKIFLTDNGKKLLEQIDRHMDKYEPLSVDLSENEAQLLNALLDKMRDHKTDR